MIHGSINWFGSTFYFGFRAPLLSVRMKSYMLQNSCAHFIHMERAFMICPFKQGPLVVVSCYGGMRLP